MKLLIAVLLLGGTVLVAPSCGKYEEGPGFSLMTKKARLAGDWDVVEYEDADGNTVSENSDDYVTFEKDGTYETTVDNVTYKGTWEFASDKEKVRVTYDYGSFSLNKTATILRLTNKELWLKDEDDKISRLEAK